MKKNKEFEKEIEKCLLDFSNIKSKNINKEKFKLLCNRIYELIKELRNKYHYEIYVDGGINDETIKFVKDSDGVIVGSYICLSDNYKTRVDNLLNAIEEK